MTDLDNQTGPKIEVGLLESLHTLFLRLVAAGCLVSSVYYWGRLVGYLGEGAYRFDMLPAHWQLAMAALAVLFPVAALGLWLEAAWGGVIWGMAALGEIAMYHFMADLFGAQPLVVALYVTVVLIWIGFRLAFFVRNRARLGRVTPGLP